MMRDLLRLFLWLGLAAPLLTAGTVEYQSTNLGQNIFRYTYSLSGFAFQQNEELAIEFNPALFGTLSNAQVGSGFMATLLPTNNPPGASGIYSALALVANPSLAGPFSVDVVYLGQGMPGAQAFSINQYDQDLNFITTLESGVTTPLGAPAVPEPGTCSLIGAGLLAAAFGLRRRRKSNAD
jgi:hypothetical protein